jgi:hypothetical protein
MHLHGLLSRRPQRGSGLGRVTVVLPFACFLWLPTRVGVIQSRIRSVCFFVWFDVRGDFPHFLHENQRSFCYEKRQSSLAVLNLAKHGSVRTQS